MRRVSCFSTIAALGDSPACRHAAFSPLTTQNAPEMTAQVEHMIAGAANLTNLVTHSNELYGTNAGHLRANGIVPPSTERQVPVAGRGRR